MFSLREILLGCIVLNSSVSGDDGSVCSNVKIENVFHAGKTQKSYLPGRFLVKSANNHPLEIPGFPSHVDFCYETAFVSAWARCYNQVTVPSLLKLDLTTTIVEVSFVDDNCTAVDCTPENLFDLFKKDSPHCIPHFEKREVLPICRSPFRDDPRCLFRGHNYFFRPLPETGEQIREFRLKFQKIASCFTST